MIRTTFEERRRLESLDPAALEEHQITRLNGLLDQILPANPFYAEKLADIQRPLRSLDDLAQLPFTFKEDLLGSAPHSPLAHNLTFPPRSLRQVPSDVGDARPAAGGARYGRRLAVVARQF